MTDKIYYKIQYPLKQVINILKDVDSAEILNENFSQEELENIQNFVNEWNNDGRQKLREIINDLRKKQN